MTETQTRSDTDKAQKARWLCDLLRQDFPACFKKTGEKCPIKSGIHKDLLVHYKEDNRFTEDELRLALAFYTRGADYLKSIINGTARIGLDGKEAECVDKGEEQYAQRLLAARAETRTQPMLAKTYVKPMLVNALAANNDTIEEISQAIQTPAKNKRTDKKIAYVE